MRIAVDAMGGDYAPEAIVEGAVQAAEEYGLTIVLVGQEDLVKKELEKYDTSRLDIIVKHASEVVEMHDLPSVALRRKRDSSMHGAIGLLKLGEADAAVTAGNTGAGMAISKLTCRVIQGIERPALATVLPNLTGKTIMIDVGANVDCKPLHLLQFAAMGHVYAKEVFHIENPRIGLLSIGEEDTKGNELTKEVFEPLRKSGLNFIGNAEGRDVFNGKVDVVVCDGFIGNVVLKVAESLARTMSLMLKEGFSQNWRTKLGYLLGKPAIDYLRKRTDYSEYGGAPLLGVNGVVIISHGSSKAKAIKNAIRVAAESVTQQINSKIEDVITQCEFDIKSRARATSLWQQFKESIRHESEKGKGEADKEKKIEPEKVIVVSEVTDLKRDSGESVKKSWWLLKDSKPRENKKDDSETSEEDGQDAEEAIQEVETILESVEQESVPGEVAPEKPQKFDGEKKAWWWFKDGKLRDNEDDAMLLEKEESDSPPEQPAIIDQKNLLPETPQESAAVSEESERPKKSWWKRKEGGSVQQKGDQEKPADEPEPLSEEPT